MIATDLHLSSLVGVPELQDVHQVDTAPASFSYFDNICGVQDQGSSQMCSVYSINYLVEIILGLRGVTGCRTLNFRDLYDRRPQKQTEGMSYRDAFNIMESHGFLVDNKRMFSKGYTVLKGLDLVRRSLIAIGPVLMALPVYDSDADHFWAGAGQPLGYHGICCTGYTDTGFELVNSYGSTWGSGGRTELSYADFGAVKECWMLFIA